MQKFKQYRMNLFFEPLTDCLQNQLTPASQEDAMGILSHEQTGKSVAHGSLYPKSNPATCKHLPIVSVMGHHGNKRAVPVNHKKGFQATAGACLSLLERALGQKKWDSFF